MRSATFRDVNIGGSRWVALASVALALVVTACSGGTDETVVPLTDPPTTSTTASPTSAPTTTAAPTTTTPTPIVETTVTTTAAPAAVEISVLRVSACSGSSRLTGAALTGLRESNSSRALISKGTTVDGGIGRSLAGSAPLLPSVVTGIGCRSGP